jgi:hypothetical protein
LNLIPFTELLNNNLQNMNTPQIFSPATTNYLP